MNKVKSKEIIIGKFYMITYDNQVLEFAVKSNNLMYCDAISKEESITKLVVKPNFEVKLESGKILTYSKESSPVGHFHIMPNLMEYLTYQQLVEYNLDMADLYGFSPEYATNAPVKGKPFVKNRCRKICNNQKRAKY